MANVPMAWTLVYPMRPDFDDAARRTEVPASSSIIAGASAYKTSLPLLSFSSASPKEQRV